MVFEAAERHPPTRVVARHRVQGSSCCMEPGRVVRALGCGWWRVVMRPHGCKGTTACRSNTFGQPLDELRDENDTVPPLQSVAVYVCTDGVMLVGAAAGPDPSSVETTTTSSPRLTIFGRRGAKDKNNGPEPVWLDFIRINTLTCHNNPLCVSHCGNRASPASCCPDACAWPCWLCVIPCCRDGKSVRLRFERLRAFELVFPSSLDSAKMVDAIEQAHQSVTSAEQESDAMKQTVRGAPCSRLLAGGHR